MKETMTESLKKAKRLFFRLVDQYEHVIFAFLNGVFAGIVASLLVSWVILGAAYSPFTSPDIRVADQHSTQDGSEIVLINSGNGKAENVLVEVQSEETEFNETWEIDYFEEKQSFSRNLGLKPKTENETHIKTNIEITDQVAAVELCSSLSNSRSNNSFYTGTPVANPYQQVGELEYYDNGSISRNGTEIANISRVQTTEEIQIPTSFQIRVIDGRGNIQSVKTFYHPRTETKVGETNETISPPKTIRVWQGSDGRCYYNGNPLDELI
jgi:hypothetical protein